MPVSLLDEANGSLLGSLELEAHNTMEHPVDGTGVMVGFLNSVSFSGWYIEPADTLRGSWAHAERCHGSLRRPKFRLICPFN